MLTIHLHYAKTNPVKHLEEGTHNMKNKLEEINLAMVAIKFGEEVAKRIADAFTDEDIDSTKRQIIVNKRKQASMARWGKKSDPVVNEPAPEPIPVIEEAPADYVDPIQKEANKVIDKLEHQTYTAKSNPVMSKASDNELTNTLNDLGIDVTPKTGCLGDDWDDNKLLTEEMKQDMRELGLDKVPKEYGQPYNRQFDQEKSDAFMKKYSTPQTASFLNMLPK